jgi:signal transduction histidine kinase
MDDPRLREYARAIRQMAAGRFDIELTTCDSDDDLSELGRSLVELASAFEARIGELRTLSSVTEQINSGLVLEEVCDHVYERFRPLLPYDRIGVSLLEKDDTIVRARWARTEAPIAKIESGYEARLEGSSLMRVFETGQPRILNDLEGYLREHPRSDSTRRIVEEGMRSSLTCPLVARGRRVGFMFFSSMRAETYRQEHVQRFLRIAGQLSLIIEKGRLYEELLELSELKNRFLGVAAHDLRSPLGTLRGYIYLLASGNDLPDGAKETLERMDRACKTMLRLVEDFLDVSVIESGRLELDRRDTDLFTYLRECHADNLPLAKARQIDLRLDLEPGLPTIAIDPNRLSQVINNLIGNALKFSGRQTTVTLGARASGNVVRISITDEGPGIPAHEIDQIFTGFSRASVRPATTAKSTGLGLAIAKRLVEAHGGTIGARSKVGRGTTIVFSLPVSRGGGRARAIREQ